MLVAGSSLALEIEYQTQTMKINTSRAGSIQLSISQSPKMNLGKLQKPPLSKYKNPKRKFKGKENRSKEFKSFLALKTCNKLKI